LACACSALLAGHAFAQTPASPSVNVQVDKARVTVGDPIQLTVTVTHAANVTITTTSLDDQLAPFEPLGSQPPQERQGSGGDQQLVMRYTIASYHTGAQQLPPFTIAYVLADGTKGQVASPAPIVVQVASVIPAGVTPTDIKPLKPQASLSAPASLSGVWAGAAGLAVLVVLAAAAIVLLVRRQGRPPAHAPALSPADAARAELERIMALDLPAKGELVEHYRLLGACVRGYLARRFQLPAAALTSGELAQWMDQRGVARWPARLVSGLLGECDAVVYARYLPAPERLAADNAMAFEVIDAAEGTTTPDAARVG
jgi:uncharacterized repeat protein (TIGR01451 family)